MGRTLSHAWQTIRSEAHAFDPLALGQQAGERDMKGFGSVGERGRSTIAEYFLTWESISPKSRPDAARSELKWFYSTL